MITISKINEVFIRVSCEKGVAQELVDLFTFQIEGYQFMPAYKSGFWDGKIRLFDTKKKLYLGLLPDLESYLKQAGYEYTIDFDSSAYEISSLELEEYIKTLNLPFEKQRDYHTKSILQCLRNSRKLIQSPTGSGKSAIIYILVRYLQDHLINKKTLIIVPTKHLVSQMIGDFKQYGYDVSKVTGIVGGIDKSKLNSVVMSTWQSIYKLDQSWFDQFDVVIGDEVHLFQASSLRGLMEKCTNTKYKFGFTGSLSDTKVHLLMLKGLFGDTYIAAKTHELMGTDLANFKIKAIVFKHERSDVLNYIKQNKIKKFDYQSEISYLQQNFKRNKFISNLSLSLKGNTLILFQNIDAQGELILNEINKRNTVGKEIFFISSQVVVEERERIRKHVNDVDKAIIVATYGTYSAGVNIPNLHNVIFAHPTKSKIRNLQSIGRGLRMGSSKQSCVLYDLSDDLRSSDKSTPNTTLSHFLERVELYNREKFKMKIYNIKL